MEFPADYQPAPDLLAGRVILVTGAGQGLGRAVAMICAKHGATVALLGRKAEKLAGTYDAIVEAGLPEPAMVPFDLSGANTPEFESLAQLVRRDLKRLDGIAHCAAFFLPLRPMADQSLDQWLMFWRVNVAAPFALTRACLPLLSAAPDSSVVFTGETHGAEPKAYWGGFAVSKAALSPLAAIWADELEHAKKPRMNVLIPGPIATPQRRQSHPGEDPRSLRPPESAAAAFLWLLGPDGAAANGATLRL